MNEHRREILDMLATGKITAEEADRLIAAMDKDRGQTVGAVSAAAEPGPRPQPKYLRVLVEAEGEKDGPVKGNVRVPMQLLRAGVRLASLIPAQARDQVNEAMREKGVVSNLTKSRPKTLKGWLNHS